MSYGCFLFSSTFNWGSNAYIGAVFSNSAYNSAESEGMYRSVFMVVFASCFMAFVGAALNYVILLIN